MSVELHHHRKRRHATKQTGLWDRLIYVVAILGPMGILPQVIQIWTEKNATGVSAITWAVYLGGAIFWGIYGVVHKEKPIILANVLTGSFTLLVLVGIILYS